MTSMPLFARRSMAATVSCHDIYFFGGVGAGGTESILDVSADMWRFSTKDYSWSEIDLCGLQPSPRRCIGFTAHDEKLLLWGGSGVDANGPGQTRHTFLNDLWAFDLQSKHWALCEMSECHLQTPLDMTRPFPRYTPVFQSLGDKVFLFGGYTEDRLGKRKLNDAWMLSAEGWQQVKMQHDEGYLHGAFWPGLRYGCMSATDGNSVYVCGGFSDDGDHIDLWCFDASTSNWRLLSPDDADEAPEARYCSAFAYWNRKLYLFGGRSRRDPKRNFNDLWTFDLDTNHWTMLTDNRTPHRYDDKAIFPGYHAKSANAVVDNCWYLWGGEGLNGHVSDFWRLDFQRVEWFLIQAARVDDPIFW